MELFQKLGCEIEERWRAQNYNEEIFPSLAAAALKSSDLPAKVSAWEIVEWTLKQVELPRQKDPRATFAEPPITLFVAPRFFIDAYIWLEGTTSIHQHSFCGAFQVLLGSSIHSWYEFDRQEAVNSFLEIGDMRLKLCQLLEVGDVQEIQAGRQYVHSLFHLDQPSVTIVVRTDRSPLFLPQFSYYKPSLAADPFYEHETTTRKLQTITALFRAKHGETDRLIAELLARSDFHTSFLILRTVHDWLKSDHLNELFDIAGPAERFERFLDLVRGRHGDKAGVLSEVFAREEMVGEIMKRRSVVTNPEHRFFLALLLNVDGKENIFQLIAQRFPDMDPVEKILDWTLDLAQTRVVGMKMQNALGIAEFDNLDLQVLEYLLRDIHENDMAGKLLEEHGEEHAADLIGKLDEKIRKIREAVIFRPLFARETNLI